MNKETFDRDVLKPLMEENISALEYFEEFQLSEINFQTKVEWNHEFLDLVSSKLRESKSSMSKEKLASYLLSFLKKTARKYDYNSSFLVQQCKRLIAYYNREQDLLSKIEALEFLVQNGIIEEGSEDFHIQLDKAYHSHQKKERIKKRKRAKI